MFCNSWIELFSFEKRIKRAFKKLRKSIPEALKNDSATVILTVLSEERETGHCDQHGTY